MQKPDSKINNCIESKIDLSMQKSPSNNLASNHALSSDLELSSYDFTLPQSLIATAPLMPKEDARLLIYHNDEIIHGTFRDLFSHIPSDYTIVLNDTKVIRSRLFAKKLSLESFIKGNKDSVFNKNFLGTLPTEREIFYHKPYSNHLHLVQIKGRVKLYDIFVMQWNEMRVYIQVVALRDDGFREVLFFTLDNHFPLNNFQLKRESLEKKVVPLTKEQVFLLIEQCGKIPLPPYIKRASTVQDCIDYQSIFAIHDGSVAAPTASLHFSDSMFSVLKRQYNHAFVTLHVGAGTFQVVNSQNILNHKMHSESCIITRENAKKIMQAKKILCVGTTAVRSVEWLIEQNLDILNKDFKKDSIIGENKLFLHPHNPPKKVKALLTNFHLPKSSLLMLVSSMLGREKTLRIYNEAIKHKYRFYSYGDGMLII